MEKLIFVAFGDSLTVGYHSPTREDEWPQPTPYTRFLKEWTERMLKQKAAALRVEFLNRGISGELTSDLVGRFDSDVVRIQPAVVIILGGSNDLGWGADPLSVAANLEWMYDEALANGIRPVACMIPSVLGFDEGIAPRLELNRLIGKCAEERKIICIDLFSATGDSKGRLKEEYSNDGLHLSPSGYEAMAEALFSGAVSRIVAERLTETKSQPSGGPSSE